MPFSLIHTSSLSILLVFLLVFLPHSTFSVDSNSPEYPPSEAPASISLPPSEAPLSSPSPASISLPPSPSPSLSPLSPSPVLPSPSNSPSDLTPSSSPPSPSPSDLMPSSSPPLEDDEDPADREQPLSAPPRMSEGIQHVAVDQAEPSGGMSGGKKAGVAIGVIAAGGVLVLGAKVYKKRQYNIRRSQYGYSARRDYL